MTYRDPQDLPDAGVRFFNHEEERRIMAFPIPGDSRQRSWGSSAIYYPRKPIESPKKWFADHAAKLASLIRAAS